VCSMWIVTPPREAISAQARNSVTAHHDSRHFRSWLQQSMPPRRSPIRILERVANCYDFVVVEMRDPSAPSSASSSIGFRSSLTTTRVTLAPCGDTAMTRPFGARRFPNSVQATERMVESSVHMGPSPIRKQWAARSKRTPSTSRSDVLSDPVLFGRRRGKHRRSALRGRTSAIVSWNTSDEAANLTGLLRRDRRSTRSLR